MRDKSDSPSECRVLKLNSVVTHDDEPDVVYPLFSVIAEVKSYLQPCYLAGLPDVQTSLRFVRFGIPHHENLSQCSYCPKEEYSELLPNCTTTNI
jgi:hypothetical protein